MILLCLLLNYFLEQAKLLKGQVVFELSIEYFCLADVDFEVKRVIYENGVVLFVIYFEESCPKYLKWLFYIFESISELSFSQGDLGQQQIASGSLRVKSYQLKIFDLQSRSLRLPE